MKILKAIASSLWIILNLIVNVYFCLENLAPHDSLITINSAINENVQLNENKCCVYKSKVLYNLCSAAWTVNTSWKTLTQTVRMKDVTTRCYSWHVHHIQTHWTCCSSLLQLLWCWLSELLESSDLLFQRSEYLSIESREGNIQVSVASCGDQDGESRCREDAQQ